MKKDKKKKKKKPINILTTFFIYHKSDVKTFLKQIINHYPKDTRQHESCYISESKIDLNNGFFSGR